MELRPGSDESIKAGCTCPVMDNYHGEGILIDGNRQFWIDSHCPLHGLKNYFPWIEPEAI